MANEEGSNVMVEGRIVWTSAKTLFEGEPALDQNTKQPRFDKNGKPLLQWGFGLALRKEALTQCGPGQPGEVWAAMHNECFKLFPSAAATGQVPPSFAMKYKDGDGLDHEGKPFSQREGYAGHIVLACTTYQTIQFFRFESGQHFQVNDGIKCGDYVRVQLSVKSHPAAGTSKAGLYLNPNAVLFLGYGAEIQNKPSAGAIFGFGMPALPPGASATPVGPAGGFIVPPGNPTPPVVAAPPVMPGYPQPMAPTGQIAQPPAYPSSPAAPPVPHFGVLPPAMQPPPGGMPAPAGYAPPPMPGIPQYPGVPR